MGKPKAISAQKPWVAEAAEMMCTKGPPNRIHTRMMIALSQGGSPKRKAYHEVLPAMMHMLHSTQTSQRCPSDVLSVELYGNEQ